MPIRPSSPSFATISYGKRFSRSSSSATGRTSPAAKSRTSRRICSCSSLRSNCMRRRMLLPARGRAARLAEAAAAREADEEGPHALAAARLPERPAAPAGAHRPAVGQLDRAERVHDRPGGEAEAVAAAAVREPRPARPDDVAARGPRDAEAQLRGSAVPAGGHRLPEAANVHVGAGVRPTDVLEQEVPAVRRGHDRREPNASKALAEAVAGGHP